MSFCFFFMSLYFSAIVKLMSCTVLFRLAYVILPSIYLGVSLYSSIVNGGISGTDGCLLVAFGGAALG